MPGYFDDENDDERFGDEAFDDFSTNKTATVYLVDATQTMFVPYGNGNILQTPFSDALCAICEGLKQTVMSSSSDLSAVIFFGTDKTQNYVATNDSSAEHLYILFDLARPSAARIKKLMDFQEDLTTMEQLENDLGHSCEFSFSQALYLCQDILSKASKGVLKRLMIMSCNDHPHPNDENLTRLALSRAGALQDAGIEILPITQRPPNGAFYGSQFYARIEHHRYDTAFCQDSIIGEDVEKMYDTNFRLNDLKVRILAKDHKKKPFSQVTWNLEKEGLALSVKLYTLVRKVNKPSVIWTTRGDMRTVKMSTTLYRGEIDSTVADSMSTADDTKSSQVNAVHVMPQDVVYYQEFGGKKAVFDSYEVSELKNFGPAGIDLLGFKRMQSLKIHTNFIHTGHFLYPDDNAIGGSTKLFTALLDRCLSKDVYALCRLVTKKRATPRLVALVPLACTTNSAGEQIIPSGFNIVYLPFSDDVRAIPALNLLEDEKTERVDSRAIGAAKNIIKGLKTPYRAYYSPTLQNFWSVVEAAALGSSLTEVKDDTKPRKNVSLDVQKAIMDFNAILAPEEHRPTPAKRTLSGPFDIKTVEQAACIGKLNTLTVAMMKSYIQSRIPSIDTHKMLKADLISAIQEYHLNKSSDATRGAKRLKTDDHY